MARREKPHEAVRTGSLAPPAPRGDREIVLSPTVEGRMADASRQGRTTASGAHETYEGKGGPRTYDRPGRATYAIHVAGAVVMLVIPWMLHAALDRAGEGNLPGSVAPRTWMAAPLQVIVGIVGAFLVSRRLRRSVSPGRAMAYIGAAWLLCLGASLVLSRLDARAGDVVFHLGTLMLFVLLLTDSVLRRKARGEA